MADTPPSGASTPNLSSRFASHAATTEQVIKEDAHGLITADGKRRAENEASEGRESTPKAAFKKRRKAGLKKGGLSFGNDEEDDGGNISAAPTRGSTPASGTPLDSATATDSDDPTNVVFKKKSLRPNSSVGLQPKALTKSALLKEAQIKEQLRKEYIQIQEAVKATEFALPFVFYDGKNVPGGMVRLKKGEKIWLFLERARKLGAEAGRGDKGRKDWARISVDDLMIVRGDLIIPHHYDFHYFLLNRNYGYHGQLFAYSAEPTAMTPQDLLPSKSVTGTPAPETAYLRTAAERDQEAIQQQAGPPDSDLEGYSDDPILTKVVDRRWYERNKHIYPASSWEDFDPEREEQYKKGIRKDQHGNAMFFSGAR